MVYFISHRDDSQLDVVQVIKVLSASQSVENLKQEKSVPNVMAICEFRGNSSLDSVAEIRLFAGLISLDGHDDAILDFAAWFHHEYKEPLVLGVPETLLEIELSFIQSRDALREKIDEEWG